MYPTFFGTMFCVNHYICNVVNTSFFLICVDTCIHIRTPPTWPPPTPAHHTSWRMLHTSCTQVNANTYTCHTNTREASTNSVT